MTKCRFCGLEDDKEVHPGTHECVCSKDCEIRMLNKQVEELEASYDKAVYQRNYIMENTNKALDEARNEGLEEAALWLDTEELEGLAEIIRNLKSKGGKP